MQPLQSMFRKLLQEGVNVAENNKPLEAAVEGMMATCNQLEMWMT